MTDDNPWAGQELAEGLLAQEEEAVPGIGQDSGHTGGGAPLTPLADDGRPLVYYHGLKRPSHCLALGLRRALADYVLVKALHNKGRILLALGIVFGAEGRIVRQRPLEDHLKSTAKTAYHLPVLLLTGAAVVHQLTKEVHHLGCRLDRRVAVVVQKGYHRDRTV